MKNKRPTHDTIWRNKWITSEAKSFDDMIKSYEGCFSEIKQMQADGLEADFTGASDDYIFLRSSDPILIDKYEMNEIDYEEEEEEEEEEEAEALSNPLSEEDEADMILNGRGRGSALPS